MSDTQPSTKPLVVLIGADTFAPDVNGAARFAERLAAGLVERGHEVHVAAPSGDRKHGTWVETHEGQPMMMHRLKSFRWYPHDWLRFAWPPTINRNSAKILDAIKPDVVHIQSPLVVGKGLAAEARKRNIRVVATNHLMPDNMAEHTALPAFTNNLFIWAFWKYVKPTFDIAESVTTPTRRAADFLEKFSGMTGVHAISCGIEASNYTPNFTPHTENLILFVGRLTGEKQLDVLLDAMTKLPAELGVKLEIIGDGDLRKHLEHRTVHLGISDRVKFTGYVTDEYLKDAYTRSTVFVMPSTAELQSIATMEAMASGLPVVAADAMALPHLVHDGENGYLFEPGNVTMLADRLSTVLAMPQEELDVLKSASLRLIQAHDIQRTLTTFEALYRGETVVDPVTDIEASDTEH